MTQTRSIALLAFLMIPACADVWVAPPGSSDDSAGEDGAGTITVLDGLDEAAFEVQDVSAIVEAGRPFDLAITMRNTGLRTWSGEAGYALGSQSPADNTTWGLSSIPIAYGARVAPGRSYRFETRLPAPAEPGRYTFHWRLKREGTGWFGESTTPFEIEVTCADCSQGHHAAAFVSMDAPALLAPGAPFDASVVMRNTGTSTWTAEAGFALGARSPTDNTIWGTSRLGLRPGDRVEPGESYTFAAQLTAPAEVGTYNFQWQMVQSTLGWFGAPTDHGVVDVDCDGCEAPANNALLVTMAVPSSVQPDELFDVEITVQNTGTAIWSDAGGYALGSQSPPDNARWGTNRITLAGSDTVAPGASYTFRRMLEAPSTPGVYDFQWQMVTQGTRYFGALTTNSPVEVVATNPVLEASFVAQTVPSRLLSGSSFEVAVSVRNDGNTTWRRQDGFALGSHNPSDNTEWGTSRLQLGATEAVAPGATHTFTGTLIAPATVGFRNLQWRMVQDDGSGWFGSPTDEASVEIVCASCGTHDAAFVSQEVPSSLAPGQSFTPRITMRNTGTSVWSREAAIKLSSENPQDNAFWGFPRVWMADGVLVYPGEDYTFERQLTAPTVAGSYNFQWQPLEEWVGRFGPLTPPVAIQVEAGGGCGDDCGPPTTGGLVDDALEGSTLAERHGGTFRDGGWSPDNGNDFLVYDLGSLMSRGEVVVELSNFDPASQATYPKHHIISMYTQRPGEHSLADSRGDAWWNVRVGTAYSDGPGQAGFKFLATNEAFANRDEVRRIQDRAWNTADVHTITIRWDGATIAFFLDGAELWSPPAFPGPIEVRYLYVGRDETYAGMGGPVYRNVHVAVPD